MGRERWACNSGAGEALGTHHRPHAPSQVMTDVAGNPEEERRAEFYHQPWSQEAVSRYFYCKVMETLEHEASVSFSLASHLATIFAAAYAQYLSTTLHPHAVISWLPDSSREGVPGWGTPGHSPGSL